MIVEESVIGGRIDKFIMDGGGIDERAIGSDMDGGEVGVSDPRVSADSKVPIDKKLAMGCFLSSI
jgi:hypothetical protein